MSRFGQAAASNLTTENKGFWDSARLGVGQVTLALLEGLGDDGKDCPCRFAELLCGSIFIAWYC